MKTSSYSPIVPALEELDTDWGIAMAGTPGASSRPANQGGVTAKPVVAEGQSCLPRSSTMVHSRLWAASRPHSDSAAD
ncbi:hypothetical protein A5695_16720 [Mycobacterium sp. E1747]|nr:hypothetical protein A5695_16720 [Mycobacterium sp. E1747]